MKLHGYIFVLASVWLFSACADDLGNYDYHDINEVTVSGNLEAGKMYTKMAYIDSLQFDPIIESTFGIRDDAAYEYEWKLIPVGADTAKVGQEAVLSRERRLNVPLTRKPGDYSGFFIVKDKDSGVSWTTPFFLQLKSISSEGWMILCDESGKTRMDLIFNVSEKEDMVARDIWANETFDPGRPLKLIYNYHWDSQGMLMLVTDKSTYCLDRQDLHAGEENDLKWRFGMVPEEVRLVASGMSQAAANSDDRWVIVDDKGDAWSISLLEYGSVFDYPINRINGITPFEPAPFVGVTFDIMGDGYGAAPAMLYDATHQQFVVLKGGAVYPSVMNFDGRELFDVQTGRDMVYMESTKHGLIYSILKEPETGKYFFYGIKMCAFTDMDWDTWEETVEEYNTQEYYGEVRGPESAGASLFACHHLFPYLFYASGNSVYQFDMGHPEREAVKVLEFPGEEIRVLKFNPFVSWYQYQDWERERGYRLVVGTNRIGEEKDCGTMRMYSVPDLMKPLVLTKEIDKLGKIVDITYNEPDKR